MMNLVNIHHLTVTIFFPVMKTFKVYSLSNFWICNIVLTIITMLYLTSHDLCILWLKVCIFWSPSSSSVLFCFDLCLLDSRCMQDHTVFIFLCLTSLTIMPSLFFWWLNNIPLYTCILHFLYPFIYQWTQVVSLAWLL